VRYEECVTVRRYLLLECFVGTQRQTRPYDIFGVDWRNEQGQNIGIDAVGEITVGIFTARQIEEITTLTKTSLLVVILARVSCRLDREMA